MKSILPMLYLLACSVSAASDIEPVAIDLDELDWGRPAAATDFQSGFAQLLKELTLSRVVERTMRCSQPALTLTSIGIPTTNMSWWLQAPRQSVWETKIMI